MMRTSGEMMTSIFVKVCTPISIYFFSSIRYHGSSSSIKCHVYHHVGGRRHTPLVCNESREPHTSHYTSRPITKKNNQQTESTSSKRKSYYIHPLFFLFYCMAHLYGVQLEPSFVNLKIFNTK